MTTQTVLLVADVVVGGVLVAASLGRWRTSTGALLVGSGGVWWLGSLLPALTFAHRGVLIHLVLSHPGRRLSGTGVRAVIAGGYLYACVLPLAGNDAASAVVAATVVGVAAERHLVGSGLRRRSTAFALAAAGLLAGALVVGPISRLSGVGAPTSVLAAYDLLVVGVAMLVMADVLRMSSARAAATGLVVDLGQATGSDVLRSRLAARLGDPDLLVGYWLPARGAYVDDAGRPVVMPTWGDPRSVTHLDVEGQPVAVLIHDNVVLRDPRLLDDVAAAAKWAVRNVALRTRIRDQVDGVEASRRRIITAADAERVRLEQRLQHGPGRHLQRVAELITADGSALQGLADDVDGIRTQVSELAHGLHPRTLAERGLADALGELAARSPVPVRLEVPTFRLPAATEVTLYFTCSEALANVLKYARATQVDVHVTCDEQSVTMIVADDGVGGADPRRGSGLRGLTDRVEALGGRLGVHSPPGSGTRVEVTIPLAPQPAASTVASG